MFCLQKLIKRNLSGKVESKINWQNYSQILKNETISIIGYDTKNRIKSMNLYHNKIKIIIGIENGTSWNMAISDGWLPYYTLFPIKDALEKSSIIHFNYSNENQMKIWDEIKGGLTEGKALSFSHKYKDEPKIITPPNIDIFVVTSKDTGLGVNEVNCSYTIYQDYTKRAERRCLAFGFGSGSDHMIKTLQPIKSKSKIIDIE